MERLVEGFLLFLRDVPKLLLLAFKSLDNDLLSLLESVLQIFGVKAVLNKVEITHLNLLLLFGWL